MYHRHDNKSAANVCYISIAKIVLTFYALYSIVIK